MNAKTSTTGLQRLVVAPARSQIGKFLEGASVPWLGLKVLLFRPRLWRYAVVPVLLNLAIMAAAVFAMFVIGLVLFTGLWLSLGQDWNEGWWLVGKFAIFIVGALTTVMVCIAVAVITWRLLSTLFCGYFYGLIATCVEQEFGLERRDMREISMWRELQDALRDMGWLLISLTLALIVSLIPFIGAPIALAYSLYFQILTCGRDQFSYPLSLRGQHRAQRGEFCRRHLPHIMGLGTIVLVMEFIPFVGALFMVTAAAGAVVLHRRLTEGQLAGASDLPAREEEPRRPQVSSTLE